MADRSARIAAAVARSKTEYQSRHAYTERSSVHLGWKEEDERGSKYAMEYLITRVFGVEAASKPSACGMGNDDGDVQCEGHSEMNLSADEVFEHIMNKVDYKKPQGGLSREVLDSALRMGVKRGDARVGDLADTSKGVWRAPHVGVALAAAEAYLAVGRCKDALVPLLQATTISLHHPILVSLHTVLSKLDLGLSNDAFKVQLNKFKDLVALQRDRLAYAYPLFAPRTASSAGQDDQTNAQTSASTEDLKPSPADGSILSRMTDMQIGLVSPPDLPSPGPSPHPQASIDQGSSETDETNITSDHVDLDAIVLARLLNVDENTVKQALGRLVKNVHGPKEGEGERSDRGVREL